jgi:hypothetical protein
MRRLLTSGPPHFRRCLVFPGSILSSLNDGPYLETTVCRRRRRNAVQGYRPSPADGGSYPEATARRLRTAKRLPGIRLIGPRRRLVSPDGGLSARDDGLPPATTDRRPGIQAAVGRRRFISRDDGPPSADGEAFPRDTAHRREATAHRPGIWLIVPRRRSAAGDDGTPSMDTDRRRGIQTVVWRRRFVAAGYSSSSRDGGPSSRDIDRRRRTAIRRRGIQAVVHGRRFVAARYSSPSGDDGSPSRDAARRRKPTDRRPGIQTVVAGRRTVVGGYRSSSADGNPSSRDTDRRPETTDHRPGTTIRRREIQLIVWRRRLVGRGLRSVARAYSSSSQDDQPPSGADRDASRLRLCLIPQQPEFESPEGGILLAPGVSPGNAATKHDSVPSGTAFRWRNARLRPPLFVRAHDSAIGGVTKSLRSAATPGVPGCEGTKTTTLATGQPRSSVPGLLDSCILCSYSISC